MDDRETLRAVHRARVLPLDSFSITVRPNRAHADVSAYRARIASKRRRERWPELIIAEGEEPNEPDAWLRSSEECAAAATDDLVTRLVCLHQSLDRIAPEQP